MPTIHLSVPDRIYQELKEAAEVYGIQVTDLIKVFIRNNVRLAKQGILSTSAFDEEKIQEIEEKIDKLIHSLETNKSESESQIRVLATMIRALEDKISSLELELEELKDKVEMEKPIIEPELIDR